MKPTIILKVLTLCLLGFTAGCGRPATEAECEEIVERTARLKIQETAPARPETVDKEVSRLKESLRGKILEGCVGKRITNSAMVCVREAETSDAVQECFK